jgi:hypothetical protein
MEIGVLARTAKTPSWNATLAGAGMTSLEYARGAPSRKMMLRQIGLNTTDLLLK